MALEGNEDEVPGAAERGALRILRRMGPMGAPKPKISTVGTPQFRARGGRTISRRPRAAKWLVHINMHTVRHGYCNDPLLLPQKT
jgi:hypothetical protein